MTFQDQAAETYKKEVRQLDRKNRRRETLLNISSVLMLLGLMAGAGAHMFGLPIIICEGLMVPAAIISVLVGFGIV